MKALIVSKGKDVLLALAVIDPALMLLMECPAEYSALPGFIWAITPVYGSCRHRETGKSGEQNATLGQPRRSPLCGAVWAGSRDSHLEGSTEVTQLNATSKVSILVFLLSAAWKMWPISAQHATFHSDTANNLSFGMIDCVT